MNTENTKLWDRDRVQFCVPSGEEGEESDCVLPADRVSTVNSDILAVKYTKKELLSSFTATGGKAAKHSFEHTISWFAGISQVDIRANTLSLE